MLLDWLRVEYDIAKASNKLLTPIELDSDTWVSEVKRLHGKNQPLTPYPHAMGFLLSAFAISAFQPAPARALAAEALTLEREAKSEG
jgi:hypothetical protein